MHPANQRLRKSDKLSQGTHKQTSYPRVQWENTLDEMGGYRAPGITRHVETHTEIEGNIRSRNNQEHRTTHAAGN